MVTRNKTLVILLIIQILMTGYIAYQVNDIRDSFSVLSDLGEKDNKAPTQPTQPTTVKVNLPADFTKDDPFKGDKDAKVTIVEFSDFQCPFCERFFTQTLSSIEENYVDTGKVKFRKKLLKLLNVLMNKENSGKCMTRYLRINNLWVLITINNGLKI